MRDLERLALGAGADFAPNIAALPLAKAPAAEPLTPSEFLSGQPEERMTDLMAFALAVEAGEMPGEAAVARMRIRASAELADHAARLTHNRIDEIRRDVVAEHLGRLRPPPGFATLVLANLVAIACVGAVGFWVAAGADWPGRLLSWLSG